MRSPSWMRFTPPVVLVWRILHGASARARSQDMRQLNHVVRAAATSASRQAAPGGTTIRRRIFRRGSTPTRHGHLQRSLRSSHEDLPRRHGAQRRSPGQRSPLTASPSTRGSTPSPRSAAAASASTREREWIPPQAFSALKRTVELAQKAAATPATATNNLKEIEETRAEAIRVTVEPDAGTVSTMTSGGTTITEHGHDERADDDPDQLAVVRDAAHSVGITEPDHVEASSRCTRDVQDGRRSDARSCRSSRSTLSVNSASASTTLTVSPFSMIALMTTSCTCRSSFGISSTSDQHLEMIRAINKEIDDLCAAGVFELVPFTATTTPARGCTWSTTTTCRSIPATVAATAWSPLRNAFWRNATSCTTPAPPTCFVNLNMMRWPDRSGS